MLTNLAQKLYDEGGTTRFDVNGVPRSELAGPVFSPDGNTLFVNIQSPGQTFAIWGPFQRRNSARAREMSYAAPAKQFAPQVSDKLAQVAESQGMSILEAAAFERHAPQMMFACTKHVKEALKMML